jgi:hypothetical protein
MSASSSLFSNFSTRHTQPRGYVASGDDDNNNNNNIDSNVDSNVNSNDSLTFELDRRLDKMAHAKFS